MRFRYCMFPIQTNFSSTVLVDQAVHASTVCLELCESGPSHPPFTSAVCTAANHDRGFLEIHCVYWLHFGMAPDSLNTLSDASQLFDAQQQTLAMADHTWQGIPDDLVHLSHLRQQNANLEQQHSRSAEVHRLHQHSNPVTSAEALLERIRHDSNWPGRRHSLDPIAQPVPVSAARAATAPAPAAVAATSTSIAPSGSLDALQQHAQLASIATVKTPCFLNICSTPYSHPQRHASPVSGQRSAIFEELAARDCQDAVLQWLHQSEWGNVPLQARGCPPELAPIPSRRMSSDTQMMQFPDGHNPTIPGRLQRCSSSSSTPPSEGRLSLQDQQSCIQEMCSFCLLHSSSTGCCIQYFCWQFSMTCQVKALLEGLFLAVKVALQ